MRRPLSLVATLLVLDASARAEPGPSRPVATPRVRVLPAELRLRAHRTAYLLAFAEGFEAKDLSWEIREAQGGTVTPVLAIGGLAMARYVAPEFGGDVHVVARRASDPELRAEALLHIVGPRAVSVTVDPPSASLGAGASQTFTAAVTGTSNTQVVWSASAGAIGPDGRFTAPAAPGSVTVRATSASDATKFGEASVTVNRAVLAIAPQNATLFQGEAQAFAASGQGALPLVWSVEEAGGGSVGADGRYLAPNQAGTYHVRAALQGDALAFARATVTVPAVSVSVDPAAAQMLPGERKDFSAFVNGSRTTTVTWSLSEGVGAGDLAVNGATATYTAPAAPGNYHLVARSTADATASGLARLTVLEPRSLRLAPEAVTLPLGGIQAFTAAVRGLDDKAVRWSVEEGAAGGSVTDAGVYTAPSASGTFHVVATAAADPTLRATAAVTVTSDVRVLVSPPRGTLRVGDVFNITPQVDGSTNRAVTWSAPEGGAIAPYAWYVQYTPPPTPGAYRAVATAQADTAQSATCTLTVEPPLGPLRFAPAAAPAQAHHHHTATLLRSGRVLVAGSQSWPSAATAELYDPPSAAFLPLPSMTAPRNQHSATLLADGRVLLAGGDTGWDDPRADTGELFDPASGAFSAVSNRMVQRRVSGAAARMADGRVLLAGGSKWSAYTHDVMNRGDIYDPATNAFTPLEATMMAHRMGHSATLLNDGRVLIVGGYNQDGRLMSAELFDPASRQFRYTTGSPRRARVLHSATPMADGRVLLVGGYDSRDSAEIYDPATETFSELGAGPAVGRFGHAATQLHDGRVLITGGVDAAIGATAEVFDPATQAFTVYGRSVQARESHTATLLGNGKILLVGGATNAAERSSELSD